MKNRDYDKGLIYSSFDIEWEERKIEMSSKGNEGGYVTGYAALFGEINHHNEIVHKGAFKKTIKEKVSAGKIKFLNGHDASDVNKILGIITEAKETQKGLWFKASLSNTSGVQEIKQKIKEGIINQLSISFRPIKYDFEEQDGGKVIAHLYEVELFEISAVTFASAENTAFEEVRNKNTRKLLPLHIADLINRAHKETIETDEIVDVIKQMIEFVPDQRQQILKSLTAEPDLEAERKDQKTPLTETKENSNSVKELDIEAKKLAYELAVMN